jgi:hypothetical protein
MSTKRPPQSNEESYEALQALFVKIAEGEVELLECDEVWKQVLGDPWFCAEVRLQAVRVVGGNVNDPLCDDISQDVVVKLKVKLSKHVDLGVDAGQLSGHLPGWMGEIIHCACVDTLRRERRHPHDVLTEASAVENPAALEELRLDVAEAIAQLEPRRFTAESRRVKRGLGTATTASRPHPRHLPEGEGGRNTISVSSAT